MLAGYNFLDRSLEMAVKRRRFCMHCVPFILLWPTCISQDREIMLNESVTGTGELSVLTEPATEELDNSLSFVKRFT